MFINRCVCVCTYGGNVSCLVWCYNSITLMHNGCVSFVCVYTGPANKDSVEQVDSSALLSVGVEEQQQLQRDSVSPNSADSSMSLSSPQQHSSASSLSGSDIVSDIVHSSSVKNTPSSSSASYAHFTVLHKAFVKMMIK